MLIDGASVWNIEEGEKGKGEGWDDLSWKRLGKNG